MNAPATPLPPASARHDDFPGWLPAMLVKELRQALRARGFVGLFLTFHLVAILVFWWTIELNTASGLRDTFNWLNGVFWVLLNVVLLLVMPSRGLGSLRMEIDNKTLDLLVLTRLSAWRIVLGKWVALVAQAALFLVAIAPYGVVRYFFGAVDLAADLIMAGWLLLGGATLAAVCLWVSGLPKLFRVILPDLFFLSFQSVGLSSFFSASLSGRGGLGRLPGPFSLQGVAGLFLLGLLTLIFLGLAVRRIAPPAENHARSARLLGLILLAGSALVSFGGYPGADAVLGFGCTIVALIAAVELSRDCLPMRVHGSTWGGRAWLRGFSRIMLPGWPSAVLFAGVALVPLALILGLDPSRHSGARSGLAVAWLAVLAWQALVFPALLLSYLPPSSTMRAGGTGYFVVQGLFGTISLMAATNSAGYLAGENFARTLDAICQILPVFSFWLGTNSVKTGFSPGNIIGQSVALGVLVGLIWRQSRIYWGTVARFERSGTGNPAGSP